MSPRRLLNLVAMVAVVGLLVVVLVHAFPPLVGAEASYTVLSGSMEPSIGTGDAILVDAVDPARIERGDVITFRVGTEATPTTHRVVGIDDSGDTRSFLTKGDANEDADPQPVPAAAVVGRVLIVVPYLGYLLTYINTPLGYLVFIGGPFVLLLFGELRDMVGGRSGDQSTEAVSDEPDAISDETTPDGSPGTLTISRTDLQLTLPVLVSFAAYSAWFAYRSPDSLQRVMIASGTVLFSVFLGVLYLAAPGSDNPTEATGESPAVEIRQVDGPLQAADVPVRSVQELLEMAMGTGRPVVTDHAARLYQLRDDGTVYQFHPESSLANGGPNVTARLHGKPANASPATVPALEGSDE